MFYLYVYIYSYIKTGCFHFLHFSLNNKANSILINLLSVVSFNEIVFLELKSNWNKKKAKFSIMLYQMKYILTFLSLFLKHIHNKFSNMCIFVNIYIYAYICFRFSVNFFSLVACFFSP